jgi:hypothetical protein
MKTIFLLVVLLISTAFAAPKHAGVIVKIKGKGELFVKPKKGLPQVLFEGRVYSAQKIKLGLKVRLGDIIRTNNKSKLRIVYKNGDQVTVGPATAYQIKDLNLAKGGKTGIKLMYGAIRSVISKDGPRTGMKVETRTAAMGVRGTDFFIAQRGSSGNSQVAVIRGEVEVEPKVKKKTAQAKPAKKIKVKTGYTAAINESKKGKKKVKAKVARTTKKDLVKIQMSSVIKKSEETQKAETAEVKKELAQLEKKASEGVLKDIKKYDKNLYNKIKKSKIRSVEALNTVAVKKVYRKAPDGKSVIDAEGTDVIEGAYDAYFGIEE